MLFFASWTPAVVSGEAFAQDKECTVEEDTLPKVDDNKVLEEGGLAAVKPAPIPTNYSVAPPLPSDIRNLRGIWRGQWEGTLDTMLIPFEKRGNRILACYTWGTNLKVSKGGGRVIEGVKTNSSYVFPMGKGATFSFVLEEGGTMAGAFYDRAQENVSRIVMKRFCKMADDVSAMNCP
jgi:hypothetical protein